MEADQMGSPIHQGGDMFEKYPQQPDVDVTVEVNPPIEPEKPEPEKKVETEKSWEKTVETEKVEKKRAP